MKVVFEWERGDLGCQDIYIWQRRDRGADSGLANRQKEIRCDFESESS
jgi:hypothetical protein